MAIQTRTTALQDEYVRLYCRFINSGILYDPVTPIVYITDNGLYQESSSSSTSDSYSYSTSTSISSSTESSKLVVNVLDSVGATMGTFTSDSNKNTGTSITFDFEDALTHAEFPSMLIFSSTLPVLTCGTNTEISTKWRTSTGDVWCKSATWVPGDAKYFLLDSSLAVTLVSITISVCSNESSSTSSDTTETTSSSSIPDHVIYGPFNAIRENTGLWYVDWFVPSGLPVGKYFDVWKYQWDASGATQTEIFEITVNKLDTFINSTSPAVVHSIGDTAAGLMNDLSNVFIYEVMHIPTYWEQGYRTGDNKTFNFAFGNWNQDPRPIVRVNQKIHLDGWFANYNGNIVFGKTMDLEDMIYAQYNFRYFSGEEILDFLNMGLYAMNSTPPSSQTYSNLNNAPFAWRYGILLYAAIQALRRLVFGLNFQERALIFAEKPENVQNAINNFKQLYSDYSTLWIEVKKEIKTLRLPGISQIVTPEYTLPGGRSRWFRYLYKSG